MKMHFKRRAGFTLVEILIVASVIGLLAALAIPNFLKARSNAQANVCLNSLRQIDGAKEQWALDTKAPANATPISSNLLPYIKRGFPTCPVGDRDYVIGPMGWPTQCPSFLDGSETNHVLP
jgi:prepilin-type N-terminal cleavage/methylation domain-containing protein